MVTGRFGSKGRHALGTWPVPGQPWELITRARGFRCVCWGTRPSGTSTPRALGNEIQRHQKVASDENVFLEKPRVLPGWGDFAVRQSPGPIGW